MKRKSAKPKSAKQLGASVDNILRVYTRADSRDIAQGRIWYRDANAIASRISNGDVVKGAGVIAALSPQIHWNVNILFAERAFRMRKASGHYKGLCRKANDIMRGAKPLDVIGGFKSRSFYQNIVNPSDAQAVTVDRHALGIACGKVLSDKVRKNLSKRATVYNAIATMYREAATMLGMLPCELQAITWLTWRRELGIS
jgi:hypothetical protein